MRCSIRRCSSSSTARSSSTAATAEGRLTALTVRLEAAETDRDLAQRRVAQLGDQVSDLALALARLGAATPDDATR
ncbi:hypothetical protein DKT68_06375 [Micromonospora acroterricola]|uniref:Uncharacterized protein n=1 Tax=Micromonospora acroterricola TaxID=2202421 RepID=A0A317D9K5_9ACTN|nr:hypothetical protein [Micromonospora acroterricola]PWR11267.1 hypothetical protein DKT68_06375 [Micromonospora acroterricola]